MTSPVNADDYRDWKKTDRKAKKIIGFSLSARHLKHVSRVATAKEMWQSTLDLFERTLLNKLAARRNFCAANTREDKRIIQFVSSLRKHASTLKSMGLEIDDKEMAMAAFNGLPERFDSLICSLDVLGNENDTFTLDFVKSRLLQEE